MGETPADTEREINHLRGDMSAALEEIERRLRGGLRSVATAEARITSVRATEDFVLKRGVKQVRGELSETAERVAERLEQSRHQLERGLLPSGVLLKLEPEDGGYVRVSDARLEPPANKKRGRSPVIKKFIWAALLSIFMALGSVLARRLADSVWRATVREEPPTSKSKVDDD